MFKSAGRPLLIKLRDFQMSVYRSMRYFQGRFKQEFAIHKSKFLILPTILLLYDSDPTGSLDMNLLLLPTKTFRINYVY